MSDDIFKKIQSSDAGFQFVERLERKEHQRWLKNMLRSSRPVTARHKLNPVRTT